MVPLVISCEQGGITVHNLLFPTKSGANFLFELSVGGCTQLTQISAA